MFNKSLILLTACMSFIGVAQGYEGDATYYSTGVGNCGASSKDTDYILALSTAEYDGGAHCYRKAQVRYGGKTIYCTIVDSCQGCSQYSIDLSPSAFQALSPLSAGRIQVNWTYV